jgi:hypothetical protein
MEAKVAAAIKHLNALCEDTFPPAATPTPLPATPTVRFAIPALP